MPSSMLMKQRWFPRPHNMDISWGHGLETGVVNQATIIPIAFNDEGLGAPNTYNANPEHASFAEVDMPNCFPESKVNIISTNLRFTLTKDAIETDKLPAVNVAYMPIFTSFDDITALDKVSTLDIGEILELQRESTDFQSYPLWNGVDMPAGLGANPSSLNANVPGLTTDQKLEAVAFSPDTYYDALHYYTNSKKLQNCQGGLKWKTLTKYRPTFTRDIFIRPKIKKMNDYTFFGLLTYVPSAGNNNQLVSAADTTNVTHVDCSVNIRYNEWHQSFDFERA